MGLFHKKSDILKCPILHLEGISALSNQERCIIYYDENKLIIEVLSNKQKYELLFSQIVHIEQNFHQQIIERKKSIIQRSLIGNALFGQTGAIIGGLSGLDKKETALSVYDLFIAYNPSNNDEIKTLIFRSMNNKICQKIVDNVNNNISKNNNIKL